uniref:Relaxin-3-like n=1 Tax=Pundamilia nyererei TaxID=303518 RepID=A0A3B4G1K3_9CICH
MRALVVLPLLLCAVVCVDQVRAQVTAMKLCGKQLINAISYTCGASRWRRFFSEPDCSLMCFVLPTGEQSSLEKFSSLASEMTKRDNNIFLANMCCQVGCRKTDLAHFC